MSAHDWIGNLIYLVAPVECVVCGYEWVAVFPVEATALECKGCGYMNAVPPDAPQWDDTEDLSEAP